MSSKRQLTLYLITLCMALLLAPMVRAQSCTFTATDVNFALTDVLGARPTDAVGNINVHCGSFLGLLSSIEMRVHMGDGQGGASSNLRRMTSATTATPLGYELYQDPAHSVVFGGAYSTHGGQPVHLTGASLLNILTTTGHNIPIYGRVPGAQSGTIPGNYVSSFARNPLDVRVDYRTCNLLLLCVNRTASFSFSVRSQVVPDCRVESASLDFGTHGFLDRSVDASSQIQVTCTSGSSYQVGLGYGLNGNSFTSRAMQDLNGNLIRYDLYRDGGRSQSWGLMGDGLAATSMGSGGSQALTVYGRVPAQTTPPPGNYADTVVITVTY